MQQVRPTPFILQLSQLQDKLNPDQLEALNGEFRNIPADSQYQAIGRPTKEIVWNRVHALSALALGVLTAYVYKQTQKNLAIALGVLAVVQLFNSRSSKVTPPDMQLTPQFGEQLQKIQNLFFGVTEQFIAMHEMASGAIAHQVNQENKQELEGAKNRAQELFRAYKEKQDPFDNLEQPQEAYREQMAACFIGAQHFAQLPNDFISGIASEPLRLEVTRVKSAAQILVYGRVPQDQENLQEIPYVELTQAQQGEQVQAQAWPLGQPE